ncbi:MAG: hypothetical protein LBQ02_02950 [Candidatus Nomurabacteria bacterium]|jgi:exopolysaccharide biosynthesis protein|nr:hypothetical protein [Candidatus Nomurabacteria bacterium]
MRDKLGVKAHHKKLKTTSSLKLTLNKLSFFRRYKLTFVAVSLFLVGALSVVFYHTIRPTEAATANITVTDNHQTITTAQDSAITRTSKVKVEDSTATYGYTLTGATVSISNANSTECPHVRGHRRHITPTNHHRPYQRRELHLLCSL